MSDGVSIAVVGSINLDLVASVQAFPQPGETVTNATVARCPGGKGANQALAAHRLGAQVYMVGCVGNDPVAEEALQGLNNEGVNLDYCHRLDDIPTGLAIIIVDADGENQIVVAPGANAAFGSEQLNLPHTDAVIAQLEVPVETVLKAAANGSGFFCLNAAPARTVPIELLDRVDLLVVNEVEAQSLGPDIAAYKGLLAITYGGEGALLSRNGRQIASAKPPEVQVVDTTGAGDAFTAALTVGLVSGLSPVRALHRACNAGALTTTRMGAQSSPTGTELERLDLV